LNHFAALANHILARTRLGQGLQGKYAIEHNTMQRLLDLLNEMIELRRSLPVAPNWADSDAIKAFLAQRREFKRAAEYDSDNVRRLLGIKE